MTFTTDRANKNCELGAVTVYCDGGEWGWTFRCVAFNRKLRGTAQRLSDLFNVIERAVRDPRAQWRVLDEKKEDEWRKAKKKVDEKPK